MRKHALPALQTGTSQNQLDLHYITPRLLPQECDLVLCAECSTGGRWLPLEYVIGALVALEKVGGLPSAPGMSTEEVEAAIEACGGPNYEEALAASLGTCAES